MDDEEFNYGVGRHWKGESGQVSMYTYMSEIHYGTMKEAKDLLKYVKSKRPDNDWKIFKLVEAA